VLERDTPVQEEQGQPRHRDVGPGGRGKGLAGGNIGLEGADGCASRGEQARFGRAVPGDGRDHVGEVDAGNLEEALERGVTPTKVVVRFGGKAFEEGRSEDVVTPRDPIGTRVGED